MSPPATRPRPSKIAAELAAIAATGMVLPGSITQRRTRCGRRNCACHADPPRLHGPYWQWTRKIAAKTIGRWLSHDQHHDYQAWIDNDRRMHELLDRLEALGTQPSKPIPAGTASQPRQMWPKRLTCGQPPSRSTSNQVSPKREDHTIFRSLVRQSSDNGVGFRAGARLNVQAGLGPATWTTVPGQFSRVRASG